MNDPVWEFIKSDIIALRSDIKGIRKDIKLLLRKESKLEGKETVIVCVLTIGISILFQLAIKYVFI